MTKRNEKTSPATPASDKRDQVTQDNSLAEVKELSFEDTSVVFKNKNGLWRISLRQLADYYGMPFSDASRKLTKNPELFRDLESGGVTPSVNGSIFDYDLSIRDAVSFLTLLNYKRYQDERRQKLIRMRNWLTDTAEKILTGEMLLVKNEEWDAVRYLSKDGFKRAAKSIHDFLHTLARDPNHENLVQGNNAIMVNKIVFGYHEKGMRNKATVKQLEAVFALDQMNSALIEQGKNVQKERTQILTDYFNRHFAHLAVASTPSPVLVGSEA